MFPGFHLITITKVFKQISRSDFMEKLKKHTPIFILSAAILGIVGTLNYVNSESDLERKISAADLPIGLNKNLIASVKGNKYHISNCKYMKTILADNVLYFEREDLAEDRGYTACRYCIKSK
jgi:hypothetical protein